MNSEWKEYKLGEAPLEIIDGDRGKNYPSQSEFSEKGYCLFLSTKNVRYDGFDFTDCQFVSKEKDDKLRKGKLKRFDIVLTTRGTIGNIGFYDKTVEHEHIRINSGMVIIRPTGKLDPIFNYYTFRKLQGTFNSFVSGSAQPQLPIRDLNKLTINLPPLPEQKKIAEILSSLDDKIELNNKMNKTLEEMAQAIFKQWFVDFKFPDENGNPYKSSGGKMIQSELGEIPDGWCVGKLGDIVEINPKTDLKKGTRAKYIEMKSLSNSQSIISNIIEREFTGSGSKFVNHDTLMARITPCLENGKAGYVDFLEESEIGWGSTEFNVLRAKNKIPKEYCYLLSRNDEFRKYAIGNMNGSSGRQRVPGTILKDFKVVIPIEKVFRLFENHSGCIMNQISKNRIENIALTKTRDELLPRLMSGELRF